MTKDRTPGPQRDPSPGGIRYLIGIGASAGGLDPLFEVLGHIPAGKGLAVLVLQHRSSSHDGGLEALLGQHTAMPVARLTGPVAPEPDHVYVVGPDELVTARTDLLVPRPLPEGEPRSRVMPIDRMFRSLARHWGERAAAVVLSGSNQDGAAGAQDVHAANGVTLAQDPETAEYAQMPAAAIATGHVDLVRAPAQIGAELGRLPERLPAPRQEAGPPAPPRALARVHELLASEYGVDFGQYKESTFLRRLQRRMALQGIQDLDAYVKRLRKDGGELERLYNDALIRVTHFFRDPEVFEALKERVLRGLVEDEARREPIRLWVPACATGEEAYAAAMALVEAVPMDMAMPPAQVFGTDLHAAAIEQARAGVYPPSIAEDLSPERLRRFFTRTEGGYRISQQVRELCVFARHDLTRDPPFSRLDAVLCRNLLIYLKPERQRHLLATFHYALKDGGHLLLGSAETAGQRPELFETVDKGAHLFRAKAVQSRELGLHRPDVAPHPAPEGGQAPGRGEPASSREANRILLSRYAPPGVVVDESNHILETHGRTGPFLELAPGEPSFNLLKMLRQGLLHAVRTALQKAKADHAEAQVEGATVRYNGHALRVRVVVIPLGRDDRGRHLVLFEKTGDGAAEHPAPEAAAAPRDEAGRDRELEGLRKELDASRDYLGAVIQDLEAANEELQSANEELQSTNEELQSTNEELDTAREELQSTNEELNTLNDELHTRNQELSTANSDLENLIASIQLPIVIVDGERRIRRLTPAAEAALNMMPGDVGRPLRHIKPDLEGPELDPLVARVIESGRPEEVEVGARGEAYAVQIHPYRDQDNRIDGAVISMLHVHAGRREAVAAAEGTRYLRLMADAMGQPVLLMRPDLTPLHVNPAFRERFGLAAQPRGRPREPLGGWPWEDPDLGRALDEVNGAPPGKPVRAGAAGVELRRLAGQEQETPGLILAILDGQS